MRRVAITGIGIVSSIGNNVEEVTNALRNGTSGIVAAPEYAELGFRSQVHGTVKVDVTEHIDRKQLRFMGEGAAYAVLAMEQAIADAGLDARMLLQVHDELIFEADAGIAEDAVAVIRNVMEGAAAPVLDLAVPLVAEAGIADSWAEAH